MPNNNKRAISTPKIKGGLKASMNKGSEVIHMQSVD